jgi:AraC family transcriptional regulator of arabinose operon
LEPPKTPTAWRSAPCFSLSWKVGVKWHYIAGDCVERMAHEEEVGAEYKGHAYYGLNMVLEGRAEYVDWNQQRHSLQSGVIFQRLPDKNHSIVIDPDYRWCEIYISIRKRTIKHLQDLGLIVDCPVYYVRHPELMLSQFRDILIKLGQADTSHMPGLLVQVQQLLMAINEDAQWEYDPDPHHNLITDACTILDCDLEVDLDIESVAEAVGMSYETFRKAFKERRGIAPGAYRVRKRIERSCILLRTTMLPMNVIAEQLGYSDGFSYSAQFKKIIGMSPTAYRQMN